jgi:large subunit ribosomal protein L21
VHEGSVLNVATLDAEPGARVELRDVLLVTHEGKSTVGAPTVDGAVVVAEVVEHGRGKKVVNFKYKAKVRYRRKRGHRQGFTTLSVREITANGVTVKAPEPEAPPAPPARPSGFAGRVEPETPVAAGRVEDAEATAAEEEANAAEASEAEAPAAEGASTEETAPRPRRRRRASEDEPSEEATNE